MSYSKNKIRILHLEDLPADAELVKWQLWKGNFDFEIVLVDNRKDYQDALHSFSPDVIISDHSLPSFNSIDALILKKEWKPDIPFILVTSTVSEEFAVRVMKEGASDYILKDRLERLPSSVINCIEKFRAEQDKIKVQKQLLESRANLKAILDNTDTGYILISPELKVASFNQRAVELVQSQFGKPLTKGIFVPDFFREDRKHRITEILNKAMLGEKIEYEISYAQPDRSYRWFFVSYAGISDAENKILGVIMSITDINRRKLSEIEKDLITTDLIKRNSAMEQFSYIVSHNLRAPVSSILGLEYLLRDGGLNEEESKEIHNALTVATANLDTIVKDLNEILQLTQYASEQLSDVSLPELIGGIESAIIHSIEKEQANLICDFASVNSVKATRSNLYSIFYNLIVNSIKFHRKGVPPIIRIIAKRDGDMILFSVKDNGQGIDLDKHEKSLFGLYNTFNTTSSGRGMGLFMVKTQVDLLNGMITVSSKEGEGTEFLISFPDPALNGAQISSI
jgi:signal transduction histidine kinase